MTRNVQLLLGCVSLLYSVRSAGAQLECSFDEPSGPWNVGSNWSCEQIPTASDTVIIPVGHTVTIDQFAADAKDITVGIDPDGAQGVIVIRRGGKLTLHGASGQTTEDIINGVVRLEVSNCSGGNCGLPEIIVKNVHRFVRTSGAGTNKNVVGANNLRDAPGDDHYGIIKGYDSGARLILGEQGATYFPGLLGNLDVQVKLENHGDVNANPETGTAIRARLKLTTNTKSGSGKWKSTYGDLVVEIGVTAADGNPIWEAGTDGRIYIEAALTSNSSAQDPGLISAISDGELYVNATVSGSADWLLEERNNVCCPLIQINAACTLLSGNVLMHDGTFHANRNFCTSGQFERDGGSIVLGTYSPAVSVRFSQPCP